jgi:hypothetical protein
MAGGNLSKFLLFVTWLHGLPRSCCAALPQWHSACQGGLVVPSWHTSPSLHYSSRMCTEACEVQAEWLEVLCLLVRGGACGRHALLLGSGTCLCWCMAFQHAA